MITFEVSKRPRESRIVKKKNGDEELIIYCSQDELNDSLKVAFEQLRGVEKVTVPGSK